jgi:DNA-binding MarR family transcriptional regulator
MAQLERYPQGLKMSELSRRLMVTGGNVTGLTDQLVAEGLVERQRVPDDRRAYAVRLTAEGKRVFDGMAAEHEQWVIAMMAGLPADRQASLYGLLGELKASLRPDAEDAT